MTSPEVKGKKTNRKPSKEIRELVAKNVRDRRIRREYTQERLAKLCGCTKTFIGNIETGAASNVVLSTLEMLAGGLGCDPVDLVSRPRPSGHAEVSTKPVGLAYPHDSPPTGETQNIT